MSTGRPPIGRKETLFIALSCVPEWVSCSMHEGSVFVAHIDVLGVEKRVVFPADEFNVLRAEFILRRLDNKDRFREWAETLLFSC